MPSKTLPLISQQGETDRNKVVNRTQQPNPDVKCDVTAVYSDGQTRLELHVTDWDQAPSLPVEITISW